MELFVPSLTLFLVALIATYLIAPNVTPLMAGILAMVFLAYGVYDHYTMFAAEYRRSTWQEGLRVYSPAIMIAAVLLFVMYSMLAFFGGGSSAAAAMPTIAPPAPNTLTSSLVQGVSSLTNAIRRPMSSLSAPSLSSAPAASSLSSSMSSLSRMVGNAKSSLSRSFLETV